MMKHLISLLTISCLSICSAAEPEQSICNNPPTLKSALKNPSAKLDKFRGIDFTSRTELFEDELGDNYDLNSLLDNIEFDPNFEMFLDRAEPLTSVSRFLSDELRYHLLITWATDNEQKTWDRDKFFPTISTFSVGNVYIPLAHLLLNGFREDEPTRTALIDVCHTSLKNYVDVIVMFEDIDFLKSIFQSQNLNRFFQDDYVISEALTMLRMISGLCTEKPLTTKVKFSHDTVFYDSNQSELCAVSVNNELGELLKENRIVMDFSNFIVRKIPSITTAHKNINTALNEVFIKYKYLYDFLFKSNRGSSLVTEEDLTSPITAMIKYRNAFIETWQEFGNDRVFEMNYDQVKTTFYEALYQKIKLVCLTSNQQDTMNADAINSGPLVVSITL